MRVLIVDDHAVLREGLRILLELDHEVKVVGEAGTAREALDLLGTTECDVALVDLGLPDPDGLWCTREIRSRFPGVAVLVLTAGGTSRGVREAVEAGAGGYLLKRASRAEILLALRVVREGGVYLDGEAAGPMMQRLARSEVAPPEVPSPTPREAVILQLLAQGLSNTEIARRQNVSVSTVKTQIRSLFNKLTVYDRTALVLKAMNLGLVPQPDRSSTC